ncbi:MAG: AAA family ATPase, partial [Anaerolineales bacterium]
MSVPSLLPEQLYQATDLDSLTFEDTDQLEDLAEIIGQPRAVEAVRFGTGMHSAGYNIFALGPPGTGKRSLILKYFSDQASKEDIPQDWCYLHNFDQEHKPKAISLPAGLGSKLQASMVQFVDDLQTTLTAAFESDEYRTRRRMVESEVEERQEAAFEELQGKAKKDNFALLRTPAGLVFAPVKDGEVIPPEEFNKLPEDVRDEMEKQVQNLQKDLQTLLQIIPAWQRELRGNIRQLNHEITELAVTGLLEDLKTEYGEFPQVIEFLEAVQQDVIDNAARLLESESSGSSKENGESQPGPGKLSRSNDPFMRRYKINLLVDNSNLEGAPVIFEDNPTYQNLIGRVENMARLGTLMTDFTLIKPGSLHLANGGYLILDARKVLLQPYVWEALKRALGSGQIRIESPAQMLGLLSTISLDPEPIPLRLKIALLGDRLLYYLLSQSDPEFTELFKVQADFAEEIPRS